MDTLHPAAAGVDCPCGGTFNLEPVSAGPGIIREYVRLWPDMLDTVLLDDAEIDRRALLQEDRPGCRGALRPR